MECLVEFFRSYLGETGIPLGYVIRKDALVPDEPDGGYATVYDEMIRRAPHLDAAGHNLPTYLTDRTKVWELLANMCRDITCWSYIMPDASTDQRRSPTRHAQVPDSSPDRRDSFLDSRQRR